MVRFIAGFHQDPKGEWVAELSCLHNQHMRHQPPFRPRPWVLTEEGRRSMVGSEIDCPLCQRAELPEGLHLVRTAGPFDESTLPAGLRAAHRVGDRTWGRVRVTAGQVSFTLEADPPWTRRLGAGDDQAIPPGITHLLAFDGPFRLAVDFLTR